MGESFRQIPEDNRDSIEYDRVLENSQSSIEFIPASVKKRNKFNKELGPVIGITDTDDLAKLRRHLQDGEIVPQLKDVVLDIEAVNFLRQYYGFDALSQEEYDAMQLQGVIEPLSTSELSVIGDVDNKTLIEESFDETIPEDLANIQNQDIKALEKYYEAHPEEFPSEQCRDVRNWEDWRNILIQYDEEKSHWKVSYTRFFSDKDIIEEFDSEEKANEKLNELKEYNKKIALDLIKEARNFAKGTTSEVPDEYDPSRDESVPTSETSPSGLDVKTETILDKLPEAEALEQELSGLVDSIVEQETGGKLARIEGEISPGEGELETLDKSAEIEQEKQESLQAIATYQQFAQEHPFHTRDQAKNERYRALEKAAWKAQYRLAHINGGEIFALPQQRDIDLSHPEAKNTKDYLESQGYGFDENGNIITIKHYSKNIELNRPYSVSNLIGKARPAHILTDINLDAVDSDLHHTGYVLPGLNPQTPDFIVSTLSQDKFIQGVIVDDPDSIKYYSDQEPIDLSEVNTPQKSNEPPIMPIFALEPANIPSFDSGTKYSLGGESIQDPWGGESKGEIKFEKIFADSLNRNKEAQLDNLRTAYARAEELYNRNRNDESAKLELERLRGEYNQTVEEVLGIMAAQGLESEIHKVFTQEVKNLREERIVQSQELQSGFEKVINPLKERFVNFAIKHKKIISRLNLVAFGVGTTLALTGFGLPVAGGLAVLRRSVSSLMSGVSSRELARAGFEDGSIKINKFGLNINFQAAIPKLVGESLQEAYIKGANDADLSTKLSTLEAYYRLNGGKFTNASQQEAYEAILNELGTRVQRESIANQAEKEELPVNINKSDEGEVKAQPDKFVFSSPEYNQQYISRLLTTLSKERITELQKQQQKRKTADIIGFATGGTLLTIGTLLDAHRASVDSKPDIETTPPEQLQDISQLSKGETLWGEIAKQLGPNASPDQIQHALENYVQSGVGQNTMFQLAQGTEGGRGLLAQWGIDNANEMASLSKEQLYEVSRYLGPGQLEGISHFNIDHLEAFQPTEYVAPSPAESPTIEPRYPETPASSPVGTESLGSEPTVPPAAEAPVSALAPEVPPVATSEFTRDLSEALGATNMTETQLQEVIYSFATSEQGSVELYNQIISNEEGARFLSGFGVNSAADFANISPDKVYEIAQTMGVENLDQLPGFELNDILLAKFENAPDTLNLVKGAKPLSLIDNYIVQYTGDLPHSSSLGQEVLTTYLDTPEGKDWLYDAIVNNPEKLTGNQNIQFVEEYFRQKGIKSGADINWTNLTQDKRFPTSIFWRETTLTGGRKIPPLSTLLKPGQMAGIKKALQLVLTKQ
jgi:hypothetical protein